MSILEIQLTSLQRPLVHRKPAEDDLSDPSFVEIGLGPTPSRIADLILVAAFSPRLYNHLRNSLAS